MVREEAWERRTKGFWREWGGGEDSFNSLVVRETFVSLSKHTHVPVTIYVHTGNYKLTYW